MNIYVYFGYTRLQEIGSLKRFNTLKSCYWKLFPYKSNNKKYYKYMFREYRIYKKIALVFKQPTKTSDIDVKHNW